MIECICRICGKHFQVYASQYANGRRQFCSRSCLGKWKHITRDAPLEERFWAKVDKSAGPDGCWLWMGAIGTYGYGCFSFNGRPMNAHRAAYIFTHGPVPEDKEVCHNCPGGDNPSCVNPAHMFVGTHADNMDDKVAKGHYPHGEHTYNAKLTESQVLEIRAAFDVGESRVAIAKRYGITDSNVFVIGKRKTWKHL